MYKHLTVVSSKCMCTNADVAKGLNFCLILRLPLHQYLLYGSSECSDKCDVVDNVYADVVKGLHLCLILYLQPYLLYDISEGSASLRMRTLA